MIILKKNSEKLSKNIRHIESKRNTSRVKQRRPHAVAEFKGNKIFGCKI